MDPGGSMSRGQVRHSCKTRMPLRMSTRCRRLKNDMPSSEVASLPGSLTAAGTLRTVMSPMLTRSSITGAMRAKPLAVQGEAGNVKVVSGPWNEEWLRHMHNQPETDHDDIMDASSGSFSDLAGATGAWIA